MDLLITPAPAVDGEQTMRLKAASRFAIGPHGQRQSRCNFLECTPRPGSVLNLRMLVFLTHTKAWVGWRSSLTINASFRRIRKTSRQILLLDQIGISAAK